MKVFLFVAVAIFGSALAEPVIKDQEDPEFYASLLRLENEFKQNPGMTRILEGQILAIIESFFNSFGDPNFSEHNEFNIYVPNLIRFNSSFTNTTITGMHNYVVDPLEFKLVPLGLKLGIEIADLKAVGLYDVDGTLLCCVPVYGDGDMDVEGEKVNFELDLTLTSFNGSLLVNSLDVQLAIGGLKLNFQNLYGGALGDLVQEVVNQNVPNYVDRIIYAHGTDISNAITSAVNLFLDGKSVNDLIDWINSFTTTTEQPPATTPTTTTTAAPTTAAPTTADPTTAAPTTAAPTTAAPTTAAPTTAAPTTAAPTTAAPTTAAPTTAAPRSILTYKSNLAAQPTPAIKARIAYNLGEPVKVYTYRG